MAEADFARAGLSAERYGRLTRRMAGLTASGAIPGIVTAVRRRGETFVAASGTLTAGGPPASNPMQRDTIVRIASVSKPIVAAAAMTLVEECRLRLDDPIDRHIPELANRRVLARLDGPLEDTVPAARPLSLRDLLTMRMGFGFVMTERGDTPIERAMHERGLMTGPMPVQESAEAWLAKLGELPLLHQPGTVWMYDTSTDVLGVLLARATGQSLGDLLRERICDPLGMKDTGFSVPPDQIHRLATCYESGQEPGSLAVWDAAEGGKWSKPPVFESARGGLVSTADDLLAFSTMLLQGGQYEGRRILARPTVQAMTTSQVTADQTAPWQFFLDDHRSWGLGMAVTIRRTSGSAVPGQFGWDGGYGTSWAADPAEDLTAVLLTQRLWDSAGGPEAYHDFWTLVYQAIDD